MRRLNQDCFRKRINKKGQIDIILLVIVALAVFGIVSYVGFVVVQDLNVDIQADPSLGENTKNLSQKTADTFAPFSDGVFALILGLFWLGGLVAAYFSDNNPFFYVVFVLITVFLMTAGGIISNTWDELTSDSGFDGVANSFPVTNYVMNNYLMVFGVVLVSTFLTVFMKNRIL